MTNLTEYLRIEIKDHGVLLSVQSKRIKEYLDWNENRVEYREFSRSSNREPCYISARNAGKFFNGNGFPNMSWLTDEDIEYGINYLYTDMITKPDFNRWIHEVELRLDAIKNEIIRNLVDAISVDDRTDLIDKVTVKSREELEALEIA